MAKSKCHIHQSCCHQPSCSEAHPGLYNKLRLLLTQHLNTARKLSAVLATVRTRSHAHTNRMCVDMCVGQCSTC